MSPPKFDRNYILSVQLADGSFLTIRPPFTIEFDITRNILTSANNCQIRIYQLNARNRDLLRYDFSNYGTVRQISLRAGYGTNLPLVFIGNIAQAWSVRESTNFISTIECFDGGFAFVNGIIPAGTNFPSGTPMETVYTTLMTYLPGVTFGALGPTFTNSPNGEQYVTSRATTYQGNTSDTLSELTGGAFFVDNGRSYILGNSECILGQVAKIDSSTGLLGTPLREDNIVRFEMLFEPGILIGQIIELRSLTNQALSSQNNRDIFDNVNGFYKIVSVKHRGMISESVCGELITTCEFFYGPKQLTTVSTQ